MTKSGALGGLSLKISHRTLENERERQLLGKEGVTGKLNFPSPDLP